jgi:hypothetical protein
MLKRSLALALVAACVAALGGCANDVSRQMTNTETRTKVIDTIASNPEMAGETMDRMMASDTTRQVVVDKAMSNADVVQALINRMAKDQTTLDAIVNVAAQDSLMHDHLVQMMKSIEAMHR